MKRQHKERTMHTGDWITGFEFIAMLTFALGLDSEHWVLFLVLAMLSCSVMTLGQAIKKSAGRQPDCGQRKINTSSLL